MKEKEIDFDDSKCVGCHTPLTERKWNASLGSGALCDKCIENLRHQDLEIQVDVVPQQKDNYSKKWIRDVHIKNLRLYSVGSEMLMIIGSLLENFWEAEKNHGNTNVDWVGDDPQKNPSTWTDRDHFEHWLMLWRQWKNDSRFCGETEDELYNRLPGILKRAWD
jgi:hypothetical protein